MRIHMLKIARSLQWDCKHVEQQDLEKDKSDSKMLVQAVVTCYVNESMA
jgi:hypothetical protein